MIGSASSTQPSRWSAAGRASVQWRPRRSCSPIRDENISMYVESSLIFRRTSKYYRDVYDPLPALQALADRTRLAVFDCIRGCGGASGYDAETGQCDAGEQDAVCLCDVKCQVPCAPSTLTHHLNVLREAGLIVTERKGRKVYATVVPASLQALSRYLGAPSVACECANTNKKELTHVN
ncbi:MAG: ArsR family transcriptional regulator [Myxococcales bacterium]|nr:MAG: ArsR family transcriptional regulator [Myxococcales bacterium]